MAGGRIQVINTRNHSFEEVIPILNINQIKGLIPHRYPFLLVDRIVELDEGKRAVGVKNVSFNEPFFQGHFPAYPVMPGVLIVEALAQVGGIVMAYGDEKGAQIGLLTTIEECRFKKQVKPGDELRLAFEVIRAKGQFVKGKGIATVNGQLACEADIMIAFQSIL